MFLIPVGRRHAGKGVPLWVFWLVVLLGILTGILLIWLDKIAKRELNLAPPIIAVLTHLRELPPGILEHAAIAISMADPDCRGLPPNTEMAPFYRGLASAAAAAMIDQARKEIGES